jgi:hypothetical protein
MSNLRIVLTLLVAFAALACDGELTRPRIDPTACASASDDPTVGCARIDARILYGNGQAASAFVTLEQLSDTARYRILAPMSDSTGHTVIEVRRRHPEALDGATVTLYVRTPPASILGTFYCVVSTAHLHFVALNTVPDTLRVTWTLATLATKDAQCTTSTMPVSVIDREHR